MLSAPISFDLLFHHKKPVQNCFRIICVFAVTWWLMIVQRFCPISLWNMIDISIWQYSGAKLTRSVSKRFGGLRIAEKSPYWKVQFLFFKSQPIGLACDMRACDVHCCRCRCPLPASSQHSRPVLHRTHRQYKNVKSNFEFRIVYFSIFFFSVSFSPHFLCCGTTIILAFVWTLDTACMQRGRCIPSAGRTVLTTPAALSWHRWSGNQVFLGTSLFWSSFASVFSSVRTRPPTFTSCTSSLLRVCPHAESANYNFILISRFRFYIAANISIFFRLLLFSCSRSLSRVRRHLLTQLPVLGAESVDGTCLPWKSRSRWIELRLRQLGSTTARHRAKTIQLN